MEPTSSDEALKGHFYPENMDVEVNGLEDTGPGSPDNDNDDVDGQAVDPTRARPKVRNLFFDDGQRRVDFVLAWSAKEDEDREDQEKAEKARKMFEDNLQKEGLQLEYDKRGTETHFVKVHAPYEVLRRYADILKIRLPMKEVGVMCGTLLGGRLNCYLLNRWLDKSRIQSDLEEILSVEG